MRRKKCQCGETPIYTPVRDVRRGHRMAVTGERIECPACGNMTGVSSSRELLHAEWNSAGWCGQAEWRGLKPQSRKAVKA